MNPKDKEISLSVEVNPEKLDRVTKEIYALIPSDKEIQHAISLFRNPVLITNEGNDFDNESEEFKQTIVYWKNKLFGTILGSIRYTDLSDMSEIEIQKTNFVSGLYIVGILKAKVERLRDEWFTRQEIVDYFTEKGLDSEGIDTILEEQEESSDDARTFLKNVMNRVNEGYEKFVINNNLTLQNENEIQEILSKYMKFNRYIAETEDTHTKDPFDGESEVFLKTIEQCYKEWSLLIGKELYGADEKINIQQPEKQELILTAKTHLFTILKIEIKRFYAEGQNTQQIVDFIIKEGLSPDIADDLIERVLTSEAMRLLNEGHDRQQITDFFSEKGLPSDFVNILIEKVIPKKKTSGRAIKSPEGNIGMVIEISDEQEIKEFIRRHRRLSDEGTLEGEDEEFLAAINQIKKKFLSTIDSASPETKDLLWTTAANVYIGGAICAGAQFLRNKGLTEQEITQLYVDNGLTAEEAKEFIEKALPHKEPNIKKSHIAMIAAIVLLAILIPIFFASSGGNGSSETGSFFGTGCFNSSSQSSVKKLLAITFEDAAKPLTDTERLMRQFQKNSKTDATINSIRTKYTKVDHITLNNIESLNDSDESNANDSDEIRCSAIATMRLSNDMADKIRKAPAAALAMRLNENTIELDVFYTIKDDVVGFGFRHPLMGFLVNAVLNTNKNTEKPNGSDSTISE